MTAAPDCPLPRGVLALSQRTHVMGIVNVTPDSFSDGGLFYDAKDAIDHGLRLAGEGADILDVGGESTRPGAQPVGAAEEVRRTAPVIEVLASKTGLPVSIDTSKIEVALAALDAGAQIVNDVTAGCLDPQILGVAARHGAAVVLMHMQGTPRTMQQSPAYDDVVVDVRDFLLERALAAEAAGIARGQILLDPGFGFGKLLKHNLALLDGLGQLCSLGYAVVSGTSRKAFIGAVLGDAAVGDRLEGTAATVAVAIARGAAIVRVHDVGAMVKVARMTDAIVRARSA